jgi:hypothetical protein
MQTAGSTCEFWVNPVNFTFSLSTSILFTLLGHIRGKDGKNTDRAGTVIGKRYWKSEKIIFVIYILSVYVWVGPVTFFCGGAGLHAVVLCHRH